MEIEKVQNFRFVKIGAVYRNLLIESKNIEKTVAFIKKENIKSIEINSQFGYKLAHVKFLQDVSNIIEKITIVDDNIDIGFIESLKNLKEVFIGGENKYPIDFSNFRHLESANLFWHKGLKNINQCRSLKELILRKYIHENKNFQQISELKHLNILNFIQPQFENLDFLKPFPTLNEFEIFKCIKLRDISGLKYVSSTLNKLVIDSCKKIENYDSIRELNSLSFLGINDSASIPSLDILKKLKKLNHFSFVGTNVIDGNLSFCNNITHVGFNNKVHYYGYKKILR